MTSSSSPRIGRDQDGMASDGMAGVKSFSHGHNEGQAKVGPAGPSCSKPVAQSVLDSICDAETLVRVADELADAHDEAYGVWTLLVEADATNPDDEFWPTRRCAKAAFSAVPALRESR